MAIAAVLTANLCNGLNTSMWTGSATFLGVVLVWIYTARDMSSWSLTYSESFLGDILSFHRVGLSPPRTATITSYCDLRTSGFTFLLPFDSLF
jgi:hypothetical protein